MGREEINPSPAPKQSMPGECYLPSVSLKMFQRICLDIQRLRRVACFVLKLFLLCFSSCYHSLFIKIKRVRCWGPSPLPCSPGRGALGGGTGFPCPWSASFPSGCFVFPCAGQGPSGPGIEQLLSRAPVMQLEK